MKFEVLTFDIDRVEREIKKAESLNIDFNILEATAIRDCYISDRELINVVAVTPLYIQGFKVNGEKEEICELIIDKSQEGIARRDYSNIIGSPHKILNQINNQLELWTLEYEKEERELIESLKQFEKKPASKKNKSKVEA